MGQPYELMIVGNLGDEVRDSVAGIVQQTDFRLTFFNSAYRAYVELGGADAVLMTDEATPRPGWTTKLGTAVSDFFSPDSASRKAQIIKDSIIRERIILTARNELSLPTGNLVVSRTASSSKEPEINVHEQIRAPSEPAPDLSSWLGHQSIKAVRRRARHQTSLQSDIALLRRFGQA